MLPDQKTVITTAEEGLIRRWDAQTGQELSALDGYASLLCSAYSSDGRLAAVGDPADPSLLAFGATLFAVGSLLCATGIYAKARILQWQGQAYQAEMASRRSRGGCELCGSEKIFQRIKEVFGIENFETSDDNMLTLFEVECIGLCEKAPAALINGEPCGPLTPDGFVETLKQLPKEPTHNGNGHH